MHRSRRKPMKNYAAGPRACKKISGRRSLESGTASVTADAPLVETSTPAPGQTVNNQDILNLPLVNRNVYNLLELTVGVDTTFAATDNFGALMRVTLENGSSNGGAGSSTTAWTAAARP